MIKEAIKYITDLKAEAMEPKVVTIAGKTYCDKVLSRYDDEPIWNLVPDRKVRRTMQAFHQRLRQPIRRIPGGSMKVRWIGVWLRNTIGFTWILQMDAFICALDSPPIRSCIRR